MTYVSDELLLAYLDGQLEKSQSAGVAQLAASNAEISRRLTRLKRTQTRFTEAFVAFADSGISNRAPRPAPSAGFIDRAPLTPGPVLRSEVRKEDATASIVRRALFVAAVFAGGVLGGYGATILTARSSSEAPKSLDRQIASPPGPATPSWSADIARFHAFFPRETLTPHADAISNPELIAFHLTKVTGRPVVPPDFARQGYTLFRGQAFNYQQERMMQLTYASKTEPPLTVYVLSAAGAADAPATVQAVGAGRAIVWIGDRVRYLLTADKSEQELKMLSVIAQSQMPKRASGG